MKHLLTGLACTALLTGSLVFAQNVEEQQKPQQQQPQEQEQQQQAQQKQGQQQTETIWGTVAGVTTVGEAVIDPQTNTAVIAEVNYLTVLGMPTGSLLGRPGAAAGQRAEQERPLPGQRQPERPLPGQQIQPERPQPERPLPGQQVQPERPQPGQQAQPERPQFGQAGQQEGQQRHNLYLVAITPETKVQKLDQPGAPGQQPGTPGQQPGADRREQPATPGQQPGADRGQEPGADQGQQQAQSAFEELEIGDRVMIQFAKTDQLQAKADPKSEQAKPKDGEERVVGFRGKPNKHGRNRIFIGEAKQISVMSDSMGQGERLRERQGERLRERQGEGFRAREGLNRERSLPNNQ